MMEGHSRAPRAWLACTSRFCWLGMLVFALSFYAGCSDDPVDPIGEDETTCSSHNECGVTEFCGADDVCVPARTCGAVSSWANCANAADQLRPTEGRAYVCKDRQCTRQCIADTDCGGDDEICTDFGECVVYDGEQLSFDSGNYDSGALRAGVGEAILNVPIGIEMGGYGSRAKSNDGRFAKALSASQGQMDAQIARAVALDNGHSRLLMMRAPIIFSFDQLHERIARNLQEETGHDWRDELILTATHTHSGPARFWRLPAESAIDPGMLGAGNFNQHVEDWLVGSLTEAALSAIANMQDAKFSWKIVEAFDMDDHVGRDRWSSTPHFDLNRMLLMRIDDLDDVPLAVLFSYGAHGTDNSGDYMTDDVLGGAERGLSEALSQEFGRYVPTLYFAENGGNMAPGAGRQGHRFPYSRERAGYVLAEKAMPVLRTMQGEREISFRSRTYRFNINFDALGYAPEDYRTAAPRPFGGVHYNGALLCGGPGADDDDYATYIPQAQLSCIPLSFVLNNFQPTPLTRSQVTALELDGLSLVTLPGESAQQVGWQVMRLLRDQFERPTSQSWVFGYTNDHLLYIVPTNLRGDAPDVPGYDDSLPAPDDYPDYAFSFLQGGYEPGMAPWGPAFGDWLIDRVGEAFAWLQDETAEPSVFGPILPAQFTRIDDPEFERDATPDDRVGTILEDLPASLERMQPVTFRWIGGDSGAEAPQAPLVTLEVLDGSAWVPAIGPDFLPINNRGHAMASRVKIVENETGVEYEWSVYWEAVKDLPVGTYRFHVAGHRYDAALERVAYDVHSEEFQLQPNASLRVMIADNSDDTTVRGQLAYVPMVQMNQNTGDERARLSGSLRLRDPRVPVHLPAPLELGADFEKADLMVYSNIQGAGDASDGESCDVLTTEFVEMEGYQGVPRTVFECDFVTDPALQSVTVRVEDRWGNSGEAVLQMGD